jgi:carbamoyl-phosphate synthase large subunit
MAFGRTIEEALQKAVRSLEVDMYFGYKEWSKEEILDILRHPTHERIFVIYYALQNGMPAAEISRITNIDPFFIKKIQNIIDAEGTLKVDISPGNLKKAKR